LFWLPPPSIHLVPILLIICFQGSYATLGAGLDLDSLEDAARSASSSRRKEELARRREEEEAAEESEVQPKVRGARAGLSSM
jgi:hypothetical protein